MSVEVHVETVIARPVPGVWDYTTAVENDVAWTGGLVEARPHGPLREGARVERVSRFLGRRMVYVVEVQRLIEHQVVEMHTSSGPFPMHIRYAYEPVPEGTRFSIHTTGDPGRFFSLASALVSRAVERQIGKDLAALKRILEG